MSLGLVPVLVYSEWLMVYTEKKKATPAPRNLLYCMIGKHAAAHRQPNLFDAAAHRQPNLFDAWRCGVLALRAACFRVAPNESGFSERKDWSRMLSAGPPHGYENMRRCIVHPEKRYVGIGIDPIPTVRLRSREKKAKDGMGIDGDREGAVTRRGERHGPTRCDQVHG